MGGEGGPKSNQNGMKHNERMERSEKNEKQGQVLKTQEMARNERKCKEMEGNVNKHNEHGPQTWATASNLCFHNVNTT